MDSWLMTTPLGNGLGTRPIRAGYSRRKEGSTFSIILSSNVCHEATYSMHRTSDTKCHRTLEQLICTYLFSDGYGANLALATRELLHTG
jgi:hypothetical protein